MGTRLVVSGLITLAVPGRLVGMYPRARQRKNRDGTVVRYVQLAHNRRVDGVTQARVLLNLGREDQLDRDGLARLVTSINRYLGTADAAAADATQLVGDGLFVTGSRPVGAVHLLDGLWRALEIDTALRKVLGPRRFTTDVERVLFALVANRAIDPMSKLSAAEWASHDVAIDSLEAMDEDQAYRAMDLLVEADAQAEVQESVFPFFPRRGQPAQPRSRPAVLRHYVHLLRARHRGQWRGGVPPLRPIPRTTVTTSRGSSSGWPSPRRASRCACGAGPATHPIRRSCPK